MSNTQHIYIPSKTFLLGEYAVLWGGTAILANTLPCFKFTIDQNEQVQQPFHDESPAGKLYKNKQKTSMGKLTFDDPHQGLGGLGASSAEFLGLYMTLLDEATLIPDDLLTAYQTYTKTEHGTAPSGVDVLSQATGNIAIISNQPGKLNCQHTIWPFPEHELLLLHTGHKLKSHEHLRDLKKIDTSILQGIVHEAQHAIQHSDAISFSEAIHEYGLALKQHHLVAPTTSSLLEKILPLPGVLAAKGCGAMGKDVVMILCEHSTKGQLSVWAESQGLLKIATHLDLTNGAHYDTHSHGPA